MAERVGDGVELAIVEDSGAGVELLEVEGLIIEELLGFRVGGDEDLEAAVEEEAVDNVGAHAASDGVGGFQEEEGDVLGVQVGGGGESGEARADDDDSGGFGEWWGLER